MVVACDFFYAKRSQITSERVKVLLKLPPKRQEIGKIETVSVIVCQSS